MIGYIKGKLIEVDGQALTVSVGAESSCVGYAVTVPGEATYAGLVTGSDVEFFIYTHVREDSLDLYGFLTRLEKSLFLTLLQVNGIGPKSALGILSGANPKDLIRAIQDGDKAFLTRVPGIGKKTAERVVLELADSVKKKFQAEKFNTPSVKMSGSAADQYVEAQSALTALGMKEAEAAYLLEKVRAQRGDVQEAKIDTQALIRSALKELGNG